MTKWLIICHYCKEVKGKIETNDEHIILSLSQKYVVQKVKSFKE